MKIIRNLEFRHRRGGGDELECYEPNLFGSLFYLRLLDLKSSVIFSLFSKLFCSLIQKIWLNRSYAFSVAWSWKMLEFRHRRTPIIVTEGLSKLCPKNTINWLLKTGSYHICIFWHFIGDKVPLLRNCGSLLS